jgi:hypothetical protein
MSEVVLVAGLPGCGKTTLRGELERQGYRVFDDYKACAHENSPRFWNSRHYDHLLQLLREGARCAAADIDFCHAEARTEAERTLRDQFPSVRLEWRFFANDPDACEANIRRRNREHLDRDLRKMREYSAIYSIPPGAVILPVVRADASSKGGPTTGCT